MKCSLIVPVAADKQEYSIEMPSAFMTGKSGDLRCMKAISGLSVESFENIYFTVLSKHEQQFSLKDLFDIQFRRHGLHNAKLVVLDQPTSSQPETVWQTIIKENITGPLFIKDSDSYFRCDVNGINGIAVYPLESLEWVNPQDKSYVAADDSDFVTNIIEKRVIGHLFSAGGYGFESSEEFKAAYEAIVLFTENSRLYISHIIYRLLLDGKIFRPIHVLDYIDLNNLSQW